jgi:hypothetical protein
MAAGLTADAILLVHFAWIAFAIFGALAIFRWRWLIWVHPPVLVWSALVMLTGWICPLTPLELHFRELAGQQGFDSGFIEHYIASLIYPAGLTRGVQIGLGLALAGFNALVYAALFQYRRRKS